MNTLRKIALTVTTMLVPVAFAAPVLAQDLPTNMQGFGVNSAPTADKLTINQTLDRAILTWDTFNIGAGKTVEFVQPYSSSATLNRVTGSTASTIAGALKANGSVYLINPNGIQITGTGTVDVGRGFVASTLDISDADFKAGRNVFSGRGGGEIRSAGRITTLANGFVGLLGGEVFAGGTITAPSGTVMIAGTTRNKLDLNGGGFLQVILPHTDVLANGSASLSLDDARKAVRYMVNLPGAVEATSVAADSGKVVLSGQIVAKSGNVNVASLGNVDLDGATIDIAHPVAKIGVDTTVVLRADALGSGTGTVSFTEYVTGHDPDTDEDIFSPSVTITGDAKDTVDIYYNPDSYSSPSNFKFNLSGANLNAWMLVNSLDNLQAIPNGTRESYALSRSIDAGATKGWNGGEGFRPLQGFMGKFDGQGHVISGLTINRPNEDDIGLFGAGTNSAEIRNLGLIDLAVTGRGAVGGLVASSQRSVMSNVYTTGKVTGSGINVGGLVGVADVTTINKAYSTAEVKGHLNVGGLVGYLKVTPELTGNSELTSSYATGAVTGAGAIGGVVGKVGDNSKVAGSFWDSYSTGVAEGFGQNDSGKPVDVTQITSDPTKTTTAFDKYSYSGLDMDKDWFMVDGSTRPFLRSEYSNTITNSHQLQLVDMDSFASYVLAGNIDLSETGRVTTGQPGSYAGMWSAKGFAPLMAFWGKFDGRGHVISDLAIKRVSESNVGLFSITVNADIRNVGLLGGLVEGKSNVGSLIGNMDGGTLENAFASTNVTSVAGAYNTGGLVGSASKVATIQNAYATGKVSGSHYVGGLVGSLSGATLTRTYAAGAVSGSAMSTTVNGLVGAWIDSTVTASYWDAFATGQSKGGAIKGVTALTSDPTQSDKGNYILKASAWSDWADQLDLTGGQAKAWRMYEGKTAPLLKAFLKPVTVSARGVYNGTATPDGMALVYSGNPDLARIKGEASFSGTNAGQYDVNIANMSSTQQGYDLIAGKFTIDKRKVYVTYTATAKSRTYGDANPVLEGDYSSTGLLAGDQLTGITWTTDATEKSGIGIYWIKGGGLSAGDNYEVIEEQAPDNSSALTVRRRPVTILYTANAVQRAYGDANPELAGVGTGIGLGLVNGDELIGTASWTTDANEKSNVGAYGILGSGLWVDENYELLGEEQAAGNATALTVNKRQVTVTANNAARIYGAANPALTYTVGANELLNGDVLSGELATVAGVRSNVGQYAITQGTLAASPNYAITFGEGSLTISPRALSIVAEAKERLAGLRNPQLTYVSSGLLDGDNFSGELGTIAGPASAPGSYAITLGTLSAGGNYTIDYTGATLTVKPTAGTAVSRILAPRGISGLPSSIDTRAMRMPVLRLKFDERIAPEQVQ